MRSSAMTFVRAAAQVLAIGVLALPLRATGALAADAPPSPGDPVVATVNGQPIHLSEVKDAADAMPASAHAMPPQTLYPMVLDQVIDAHALVLEAQKLGIDKDPAVQRQVKAAEERALQTALLRKEVAPLISEEAIRARYDRDIAGKPGEEEVHARHILVADEATAKKIIAELQKGGDFAALSAKYSTDPTAAKQGGDLGFFKKDEMVPEFANAAFALKDGEVSPTPVHTQFGWHVIQTVEHRRAPAPTFDQVHDELRQKIIQEAVQASVAKARADVTVQKFNMNGSQPRATDLAEPPPAK